MQQKDITDYNMILSGIGITESMVHPMPASNLVMHFDPANGSSFSGTTAFTDLINPSMTGNFQTIPTLDGGIGLQLFNNNYATFPIFNFPSKFTLAIWVKPWAQTFGTNIIFTNILNSSNIPGFAAGWNTVSNYDHYTIYMNGISTGGGSSSSSTVYGSWQHIVWAIDTNLPRVESFVNGVSKIVFSNGNFSFPRNQTLCIGGYPPLIGHSQYLMDGILGAIKVFSDELNDVQILSEFNATKSTYGL